jgi:hypothetical protein
MTSSPHHDTTEFLMKGKDGNEMQILRNSFNQI